jgi:hypothetical protein
MPEKRDNHHWQGDYQCLRYRRVLPYLGGAEGRSDDRSGVQWDPQWQFVTPALQLARDKTGEPVEDADSNVEILRFNSDDVFIKGANAIDREGNAGMPGEDGPVGY